MNECNNAHKLMNVVLSVARTNLVNEKRTIKTVRWMRKQSAMKIILFCSTAGFVCMVC